MQHWLQRCPSCSFVAQDIAEADPCAQQIVALAAYKDLSADHSVPELSQTFQCRALIDEANGNAGSSFQWMLAAAWDADDHGKTDLASALRRRASGLLKGREDVPIAAKLQLLDVLRRIGEWDRASELLEHLFMMSPDDGEGRVLEFQLRLIAERDVDCHRVPRPAPDMSRGTKGRRTLGALTSAEFLAKYPTKRYTRGQEEQ